METIMVKGLYGSMIAQTKAVGYCKRHGCHLTCNTLKKHECGVIHVVEDDYPRLAFEKVR